MKRIYKILLILVLIVVVLVAIINLIVYKARQQTAKDFMPIDKVVSQLHLSDLGIIKLDQKFGAHQYLEGQPATREIVVLAGGYQLDSVRQKVESRLVSAGFTSDSYNTTCTANNSCRFNTGSKLGATLALYNTGDVIIKAIDSSHADQTVPSGYVGVILDISN